MISNDYKDQLINVLYDSLNLKNLLSITSSFDVNINKITENTDQPEENTQDKISKKPKTNLFSNFLYTRPQDDEYSKTIDTKYSAKLQKTIIPKKIKNSTVIKFSENKVQVSDDTNQDTKVPILQNKVSTKNPNISIPTIEASSENNPNISIPTIEASSEKNPNISIPTIEASSEKNPNISIPMVDRQTKIDKIIKPNVSNNSDIKTNINKLVEISSSFPNDNTTMSNNMVYTSNNQEVIIPKIEDNFTEKSKSSIVASNHYDNKKYKDKKIEWIKSTSSDPYSSGYFRPNKNIKSKIKNLLFSSGFIDSDIDRIKHIDTQIENIKTFGEGGFIVPDNSTGIGMGLVGERGPETITKKGSRIQVNPINKTTKNVFNMPTSQKKINEPTIILHKNVDPKQNNLIETNPTQLSNKNSEINKLKSDLKKIEEKNKNILSEIQKLKALNQDESKKAKENSKTKDNPKLEYPTNIITQGIDSTEYYSKVFNIG